MLHTLTGRAEGVRLRPFQEPSGRSPIAVCGGGVQGIEAGQDALGAGLVDLLAESRMAVLPALQGARLPSLTQRVYRAMFLRVFERHRLGSCGTPRRWTRALRGPQGYRLCRG
jgi:hypothetical protein